MYTGKGKLPCRKWTRSGFFLHLAHPKSLHAADHSPSPDDPITLAEFRLEKTRSGTRVQATEPGFDPLPQDLRLEDFHRNQGG